MEIGNEANSVRISRNGQIWSVKYEQVCQSNTAMLEVGNEANSVRISRNGQIWSVKYEQICQSNTAMRC
ncbi:hypothetical protein SSUST1_1087 [Streptococcus suis ST1]|uniref:hypothetical protein n=1 Tax=Streptococcus suis TaxID=1307 RepID=UPI00022F8EBD|nr:hypothetical protein [Streptococcus suis]AER21456.1 hypothetical protein SSUST1_1087 [Streptococcus suis ST1]